MIWGRVVGGLLFSFTMREFCSDIESNSPSLSIYFFGFVANVFEIELFRKNGLFSYAVAPVIFS